MNFSADGVRRLCRATTATDARATAHLLGLSPGSEHDPGQALVVWVADLLLAVRLHDEDTRWRVLDAYHGLIADYGRRLEAAIEGDHAQLPVAALMFAERAYAMFQGTDWLLDLRTGERVPRGDLQFLETVLYNLATLFTRKRLEYARAAAADKEPASPAPTPPK